MVHPKRNANPSAKCPKAGSRAIEIVLEKAWDQGWWIEKAKSNHVKCLSPDGKGIVIVPSTPSDFRSIKNCRALLRKYGLKL
jgi:hypothetical protein